MSMCALNRQRATTGKRVQYGRYGLLSWFGDFSEPMEQNHDNQFNG